MSLLTATQGTPGRVYALLRLLHEAGEALPTDTISGWLVPRNVIGREEVLVLSAHNRIWDDGEVAPWMPDPAVDPGVVAVEIGLCFPTPRGICAIVQAK